MKKRIIMISVVGVLLVVAAVAFVLYTKMSAADKDVESITQLKEESLSSSQLEKLTQTFVKDRKQLEQAAKSADTSSQLWLSVLEKQSTHEDSTVKLAVASLLADLEGESPSKLLNKLSRDEKLDETTKLGVQKIILEKRFSGKSEEEQRDEARKLLDDSRPGFRLHALEIISEAPTPKDIEKMRVMAKEDEDENVQMMAEMLLEEVEE